VNTKHLIIHADDFGLSRGISDGILRSIRNGVVSSTSVIVQTPYISYAQALVRANPDIDWGLHVIIERPAGDLARFITGETERQISSFRQLFGFLPSHVDFHKGFRFDTRIYFAIRMLMLKYTFAFRYDNRHHIETKFYGLTGRIPNSDHISSSSLERILTAIKPGITELICHPGYTGNRLTDPYRTQRNTELTTLTSTVIKQAIVKNNIRVITFREYVRMVASL
jgi:hypothetical protein